MIYKFSQSIADVFFAMEEYVISARRQVSTMEYLNIPDILKKGKLPVEKRAFCDGGDNEYEIEFCDVSFQYPGSDTYALRHINLKSIWVFFLWYFRILSCFRLAWDRM